MVPCSGDAAATWLSRTTCWPALYWARTSGDAVKRLRNSDRPDRELRRRAHSCPSGALGLCVESLLADHRHDLPRRDVRGLVSSGSRSALHPRRRSGLGHGPPGPRGTVGSGCGPGTVGPHQLECGLRAGAGRLRGGIPKRHLRVAEDRAADLGISITPDSLIFTYDLLRPIAPDTVCHYVRSIATKVDVDTHLHALRHFGATELIGAGHGAHRRRAAGPLGRIGTHW
jgi:hypothetical protein